MYRSTFIMESTQSTTTFCPIKKHSQFNVIGGANEEPYYPRVKRMARLKPWAPWVIADHYKKEKNEHYQDNLQQNRNPKSKDKKKKRPISCHPKTFFAKLHKKQSNPHDIYYTTNPFIRHLTNPLHDTCFQGIILPFSPNPPKFSLVYLSSFFTLFLLILWMFTVAVCYSFCWQKAIIADP